MDLNQILRFYFITDENAPVWPPLKQAEIAIAAGATVIQYRHKSFSSKDFKDVEAIRDLCKRHSVPLIINDNIILAKAVDADGVHLGQTDENVSTARRIMGHDSIIGISVSTVEEMAHSDLSLCDYIGVGPVFGTATKLDASPVIGLNGLRTVCEKSPLPVVAIGGIDASRVAGCFSHGAAGIAVISAITQAADPSRRARELGSACACSPRQLKIAWNDEFTLIDKLIAGGRSSDLIASGLVIPPGDDAALLQTIKNPVITTDTQKEDTHFRRDWQTLAEIGQKAAEITFSDLAACYARPLSLFVNLSIPSYMSDTDIEDLYIGIGRVLKKYGATLGGGNISSGREFSIDLFAVGEGDPAIFPLRSNARPGDGLYVTGPLGMARAGLRCLQNSETGFPELIAKFKNPTARFDAAKVLSELGVTCVMDVSDGLAGDAGHIADASKISVRFDPASFRIDPVLDEFCRKYQSDPAKMMLSGGEDYELLFVCRPEIFDRVKPRIPEAFQVGECVSFSGAPLMNIPSDVLSFQHGKK